MSSILNPVSKAMSPAVLVAVLAAAPLWKAEAHGATTAQVIRKAAAATSALESAWKGLFPDPWKRWADMPQAFVFRGVVETGCGRLMPGNAHYCSIDNRVYFDEAFLTQITNHAAGMLGTDGDYAGIVVLAHEFGHAIRHKEDADACRDARAQKTGAGLCNRPIWDGEYPREAQADCFAGAITRRFQAQGLLDPGDIEEARWALAWSADDPGTTKDILSVLAMAGHGDAGSRIRHFEAGLRGGFSACQSAFTLTTGDFR